MSDLERLIALAGLATNDVAEACNETKMICKDCGDELGNPTTNCPHDSQDPNGEHWVEVDIDGDGDADLKVNMEDADCDCDCGESPCKACGKTHHDESMEEAVGDSAECFYELQDEFAGGEAEGAHKVLIDDLVRFLSGDQLEEFCDDFRRHYDMNEATLDEDDVEEGNEFAHELKKARDAGKKTFKVDGKEYDVKESEESDEETLEEGRMKDSVIDDSEKMSKEEFAKKHGKELADEMYEAVVSEAPTMDTTQLITLLKNAGLTEEAIEEKLNEWANTPSPEMAGEQEPTEHGEAYDFAQSVNLSLKRYLDAEDMKVGLKEHKVEDIREAYEAKKNK